MRPLRVLVLAEAIDVDRTSEGICTLKFLRSLAHAGCEVRCRFGGAIPDQLPFDIGCTLERVSYSSLGPWNAVAVAARAGGRAGSILKNAIQERSGFSPKFHHEVRMWERTAHEEIDSFVPDVIVTRGRGASFRTHAAMLRISKRPVWIANYHDPWPLADYPAPYASLEPGTPHMVRHLRQVISGADWVTFPSQRLRDWFARTHPDVEAKSSVLPHVTTPEELISGTSDAVPSPVSDSWTIVHVGTLLGPRTPTSLVNAFVSMCAGDADFRTHARLRFVGPVLTSTPSISEEHASRVDIQNRRVTYRESLDIIRSASVLVVIEADAEHSPFLPAKITDYLAARKPILLLTPPGSELARLFGPGYPYQARNGDHTGIEHCLRRLRQDTLGHAPESPVLDDLRAYCSESAVGTSFLNLAATLLDRNTSHSSSS